MNGTTSTTRRLGKASDRATQSTFTAEFTYPPSDRYQPSGERKRLIAKASIPKLPFDVVKLPFGIAIVEKKDLCRDSEKLATRSSKKF